VSFQIIWRLFFHAIWRIVLGTKGADSNDRIGFVVGSLRGRSLWIDSDYQRDLPVQKRFPKWQVSIPSLRACASLGLVTFDGLTFTANLPELERLEIVLARASRSKTKPCDVLAELIHDTLAPPSSIGT
jgi:hypothetical protein